MKILHAILLAPLLFSCTSNPPAKKTHVPPAASKPVHPAKAKAEKISKTALPAYQFFSTEEPLLHLRLTTDRSGKKTPVIPESDDPVKGLRWDDAPAGMDYEEKILGAWHGRQIVQTSYHTVVHEDGQRDQHLTNWLLSIEDSHGVLRPFFIIAQDSFTMNGADYTLVKSPSGEITGATGDWHLTGTGFYAGDATFEFRPDGPHIVKEHEGSGRYQKWTTTTYNSAGRVIKTHNSFD